MGNKTLEDSVRMRELVDECISEGVLAVSAIREYLSMKGISATGSTVNKLLRARGLVPSNGRNWRWRHNPPKGGE